ncbi:3-phosphoshikimate 1-carboxyvinyltransferase [Devosia sp.]|uniref:3-phosphoshikimate 1-carboxyvinyltransferase n=1 Tax=Devosia sp. TaxID=1871048 RepID=UPI00326338DF
MTARRAKALKGSFTLPGDQAIALRAVLIGATALGQTVLDGIPGGPTIETALAVARAFGARVDHDGDNCIIDGLGVGGLLAPLGPVQTGASRLLLLLTAGLVAPYRFATNLADAADALPTELSQPLGLMGTELSGVDGMTLMGPALPLPITAKITEPSAGIKSALLLAGLAIPGVTQITEPAVGRDHTEILLSHFGASIESQVDGQGWRTIVLTGQPDLRGQFLALPADTALASFPIVAALLVPGSEVVLPNVLVNPGRTGLIDTLLEMGGNIEFFNQRQSGGEFVADLRIRHSRLRGITIPADRTAALAHDYHALAVAAALADGETLLLGLEQLRRRDGDRIAALQVALTANHVTCEETPDRMSIVGADRCGGASIACGTDYRLAMAMLVLGLAGRDAVTVTDPASIAAVFPRFVSQFVALGAPIDARK